MNGRNLKGLRLKIYIKIPFRKLFAFIIGERI